jgi:hypothetical protein
MKRLIALLALAAGLHIVPAVADEQSSPKQVTQDFYTWYVKSLADNKVPLEDDVERLKNYVAPSLISDIDKQAKSEDGLEEDYFIKSQDYDESWLSKVQVADQGTKGASAKEGVVLGTTEDNAQRLTVLLSKGKDGWRITSVEIVPED